MDAIASVLAGLTPDLRAPGSAELVPLTTCPQTAAFHGEGDVATHTAMVLDLASELAADLGGDVAGESWAAIVLCLGALFHDIGKPETTREVEPGIFSAKGHEDAGARTVSTLFATHQGLRELPLGVYPAVHALVRDHMWTYHVDRVSAGAMLRMSHLVDPRLLAALWQADTRGRVCEDPARMADQVAYAELALTDAAAAVPDSYGVLAEALDVLSVDPCVRRQVLRTVVSGEVRTVGAASAAVFAAGKKKVSGSLTYTIGLPGLGKSTWARNVWAPATGGVVLSVAGARRRDRRASAAAVLAELPRALGAGRDVCVDATHMSRESRDVLVTYAGRYGVPLHAVYFDAPLSLSLSRQSSRPAADGVPEAACREMRAKFRWPTPDEYASLTVIPPSGRPWPYTTRTRWLRGAELTSATEDYVPPWGGG